MSFSVEAASPAASCSNEGDLDGYPYGGQLHDLSSVLCTSLSQDFVVDDDDFCPVTDQMVENVENIPGCSELNISSASEISASYDADHLADVSCLFLDDCNDNKSDNGKDITGRLIKFCGFVLFMFILLQF